MQSFRIFLVFLLFIFHSSHAVSAENTLNLSAQATKNKSGSLFNFSLNIFEKELLSAEEAFVFFAALSPDGKAIQLHWDIAEGYYLYREKIGLQLSTKDTLIYDIPRGKPKFDEAFGDVELLYDVLEFDAAIQRIDGAEKTLTLTAKFQGCAERGVCYPPMQKTVSLLLPKINSIEVQTVENNLSEQDSIVNALQNDSFALTLLSFLGFGLLLAFTPCVFPMIPILSGIIVGQGNISSRKAFLLSLSYVVASALTYMVFGILAALFGSNLQAAFQAPWVIYLFSSIFIALSLAMFGFYHLELPKGLQSKLHNSSDKHRDGSYLGVGLMGVFSSLIVGPCVAAPLAAALIYIGQTGDVILGGSALFIMGFGMGAPLLIILGLGQLISVWAGSSSFALSMMGYQVIGMYISITTSLIALIACILLAEPYGAQAIAVIISSAWIFQNVISLLFLRKLSGFWAHAGVLYSLKEVKAYLRKS